MRCNANRCQPGMFREIDHGLSQLMRGMVSPEAVASGDPRLTVLEFDTRYEVQCDLPGVGVENVTLELNEKTLRISGKRPAMAKDASVKVVMNERSAAEFDRRIQFERDVDSAAIDAELIDGVLKITIPVRAEVLPRRIEIRRASASN